MQAAARWGVSWRRWQGWEPVETTRHYDAAGNLTGTSVTTRDPEWNDENRAWSMSLLEREARTCDGCGRDLTETTDPDNEGYYEVGDPGTCYCCYARAAKAEEYFKPRPDGGGTSTPHADTLRFPVDFLRTSRRG